MVNDLAVETRGGRCTQRSKKQRACGQLEEDLRGQLCCKGCVIFANVVFSRRTSAGVEEKSVGK